MDSEYQGDLTQFFAGQQTAAFLIPPAGSGQPVGVVASGGSGDLFTEMSGANTLEYWNGAEDIQQAVNALAPQPF
ncbi:MAG: hypothetical protein WBX03_04580 [Terriglobales bacterium]